MENLQTSNNPNHIWSTPVDTAANAQQPKQSHYGLIYELSTDARYEHKALFFIVMGGDDAGERGYKPMTFDYRTGTFCWSYPCDDNENGLFGEVYDRATAMKLISHHTLNSTCNAKLKLFPIHLPFLSAKPEGYQNPYLFEGDSTQLVEERCIEYMENYCYKDERCYMPSTLGGELVGWGSLEAEDDDEQVKDEGHSQDSTASEKERAKWDKAIAYMKAFPLIDKENANDTASDALVCTTRTGLSVSLPPFPPSLTVPEGRERTVQHTYWTEKGRQYIHTALNQQLQTTPSK